MLRIRYPPYGFETNNVRISAIKKSSGGVCLLAWVAVLCSPPEGGRPSAERGVVCTKSTKIIYNVLPKPLRFAPDRPKFAPTKSPAVFVIDSGTTNTFKFLLINHCRHMSPACAYRIAPYDSLLERWLLLFLALSYSSKFEFRL